MEKRVLDLRSMSIGADRGQAHHTTGWSDRANRWWRKGLLGNMMRLEKVAHMSSFACLDTIGHIQFTIDALDLGFDRVDSDHTALCNLRV